MNNAEKMGSRIQAAGSAGRIEVVSFDLRRNLINVLGEEHYPYAEYLYHELVANAFDEDATEVQIVEETVRAGSRAGPAVYTLTIEDDGIGMDLPGLREYFTVGESGKPDRRESERFGRRLIGRIGVGKVSILKVARSWTVITERHIGLDEPVRLSVHVDVDAWITGDLPGFAVQYLEPTGKPGTRIVLEGVSTRFRQDRILRHLQRLPLGPDFKVWRNGELVPPRQWHGIDCIPIDEVVAWREGESERSERMSGEIWIRPEADSKREQAYLKEPKTEKEGLERDPAGIEVRVARDMITREFFGHESHGHQVNRIWGWVEAPWLPILGNRTDYLRDSPAGHAFYTAVKAHFDDAFNKVRYEQDKRARRRRGGEADQATGASDSEDHGNGADGTAAAAAGAPGAERHVASHESETLASRLGEIVNEVLEAMPEFTPLAPTTVRSRRGRPAKDRIYPARASDDEQLFEESRYGDSVGLRRLALEGLSEVVAGYYRPGSKPSSDIESVQVAEVTVNTAAGFQLRFVSASPVEGPYRWNDDPEGLTLDINMDHKLFDAAIEAGAQASKLHYAWLLAMAITERQMGGAGARVADVVDDLSFEIYTRTKDKRLERPTVS